MIMCVRVQEYFSVYSVYEPFLQLSKLGEIEVYAAIFATGLWLITENENQRHHEFTQI
jgi:hypothetical protein